MRRAYVAVDGAGNVYVADLYNHTIRKVTPAGVVTTLAGLAGNIGSVDGTNSAARFAYPIGVAVDMAGNVYVVDNGDYTIRKVTPVGTNWVVTTLAGLAGYIAEIDGTGSAARFNDAVWPGGGQRGQPLCGGLGQLHDPERISRQLRARADVTAAQPERRPIRFWNHRSSRLGGEHRVFE